MAQAAGLRAVFFGFRARLPNRKIRAAHINIRGPMGDCAAVCFHRRFRKGNLLRHQLGLTEQYLQFICSI